MWEPFTHGKPSEAAALSANEFPGRQYQRHRGQRPFPNGRASGSNDLSLTASSMEPFAGGRSAGNSRTFGDGRASGITTFPQRQGIGDNDLSTTAGHREATAVFRLRSLPGGIAAVVGAVHPRQAFGSSRSFGECIPRQAVPTASGAACFLRIFLL